MSDAPPVWSHLASKEMIDKTRAECGGVSLPPRIAFGSPDSVSAFLFHPMTPVVSCSSPSLRQQWRRGKNKSNRQERKVYIFFPWQSVLWLIFFRYFNFFFLVKSHPLPQRLAPIVILRFTVGFMQAFARTPWMPSRRRDLVGTSVWGSVDMCGRWWRTVAVG